MASILVVDDEEAIRTLVRRVLERRGHHVVACATAFDAVAETGPFNLLLVDLILPGVNGLAVTEVLRQRWPGLPVVLMSGYLAQETLLPKPPALFLQKPMMPAAVIEAVERMLSGNSE